MTEIGVQTPKWDRGIPSKVHDQGTQVEFDDTKSDDSFGGYLLDGFITDENYPLISLILRFSSSNLDI